MFTVGDTVMYGKEGVCIIEAVEERKFAGEVRSYYVMKSLARSNSRLYVPTDNSVLVSGIRKVMSKAEIDSLVSQINSCEVFWMPDDNLRREEYRRIIGSADCLALGKALRSIHFHRGELKEIGKKLRRFDEEFYIQGQNILFNEFAHVLNISKSEVLDYILGKNE